jgi:hypothetical protein
MSADTYMGSRDSFPAEETLRGKFIFEDDDDSWAVSETGGHDSHPKLTAADGGTGIVDLTFPTYYKDVFITATVDALVETHSSQRVCTVGAIDLTAGTASILISDLGATPAQTDPVDGSILRVKVEGYR